MDNWARDHPCEKPVVIMMSTDPSMYNRKVWSGRHFEVPVDPGQLVQLFMDQVRDQRSWAENDKVIRKRIIEHGSGRGLTQGKGRAEGSRR